MASTAAPRCGRRGAAPCPGAIHVEWTHNLTPEGTFKPAADLRTLYETAGVTPDREVITYCQGAYRAAHSYLALRLLGLPGGSQLSRVVEGMGRPARPADRNPRPVT